jgi:hypothetical protein
MSIPVYVSSSSGSIREGLPEGALSANARDLHRFLPSNSLVLLPGAAEPPLLISVLQHGNETTGWQAVQGLLKQSPRLSRSVLLYFGNLEAARIGQRHVPQQPDFNRSWPGTEQHDSALAKAIAESMASIESMAPIAAIDCHNNTGRNPHYSVIAATDQATLNLAGAFADIALYFDYPKGVQTMALSTFCPAITLECGVDGDSATLALCQDYLGKVLVNTEALLNEPQTMPQLLRMAGSIRVRKGVTFDFSGQAELSFRADLDALNFTTVPAGTCLGTSRMLDVLECRDAYGQAIDNRWLGLDGNKLVTTTEITPAMLSTNPSVVAQDCLGYVLGEFDPARPIP